MNSDTPALVSATMSTKLIHALQVNIRKYRTEKASLQGRVCRQTRKMNSPEPEYVVRTASEEVDTVAISPLHPEYMVIGTYSLVKNSEARDYEAQVRKGRLQVMTVSSTFKPSYVGMLPPSLDQQHFSCAVLDLHFHPHDGSLLGVATSSGQMHFFRFLVHGDVLGRRVIVRLLPLGCAKVAENDEHGLTPLVTQFNWFPEISPHGISGINDFQRASFAFTTSFGDTKVVNVDIPAVKDLYDNRLKKGPGKLEIICEQVHKHDLEAWTVATITLRSSHSTIYRMVLSGGDDSALIASAVETPNTSSASFSCDDLTTTSLQIWKDRRSHGAGVVAILPLPTMVLPIGDGTATDREIVPLLTGSYDEFLRVYEVDLKTYRPQLKTELRLDGGVWRLKVLDEYATLKTAQGDTVLLENNDTANTNQKLDGGEQQYHTLILASLMHAGAMVLRLTYTYGKSSSQCAWSIMPLKTFRAGHESMVYCCDARLDSPAAAGLEDANNKQNAESRNQESQETECYTIVSTSFYDMKICTRKFVDEFKVDAQRKGADIRKR